MPSPTSIHAFCDDALGALDATGVAQRISSGETNARECVEAAINRLHQVNPILNAVEFDDFDRARARAEIQTASPRGGFGGVPSATKPNIHVAGLPLTECSAAISPIPQDFDGPFTKQFLNTGLIPIASTTMPEFGWTASTERSDGSVTRNPWHTDYSAGGSSGGSAALVASGVLPIAHGNDGGGSIRIPAAACGLVGLKVSRGRLLGDSSSSNIPIKIVSEGVLVRSVRDCVNFLAAAEETYQNPRLQPVGRIEGPGSRRLRVGLCLDSPYAPRTDRETRAAVEAAGILIESLGHYVEPCNPPLSAQFMSDFYDYWSFLGFLVTKGGTRIFDGFDPAKLDPYTLGLARRFSKRVYRSPLFIARLITSMKKYDRAFRDLDVVLTPTLSHTTPLIGYLSPQQDFEQLFSRMNAYTGFTSLQNVAGAPAVSLPLGVSEIGMPIGVMLSTRLGDERTLLELALEIERASPFPLLS